MDLAIDDSMKELDSFAKTKITLCVNLDAELTGDDLTQIPAEAVDLSRQAQ